MSINHNQIRLVAMDLDGTLTQHKSRLDAECRSALFRLSQRYKLVMVCAGGCERVYKQMGEFPIDIIGFYGMQRSTMIGGRFKLIQSRSEAVDTLLMTKNANLLRKELGFTEYDGDTIEFHASGLVTFPILGTAAPLERKLSYDPDRAKRRKVYERVCEVFSTYKVFIGGSSSFDLAPPPYRKLYALTEYAQSEGFAPKEIIYFGDDYGLGGNDEDIYNSDISFVPIDDYRQFPAMVKKLLPA
jgi:HAD superfamily hydrolase (TIGR01484 family)